MTPSKPYLIRAIYDWLVDNDLTPYIVVDANSQDVQVPAEHVEDGQIILNISPNACRGLHLENDRIVFSARFSGVVKQLYFPPSTVQAIYAKENGRGMVFSEEDDSGDPPPTKTPPSSQGDTKTSRRGRPALKVVK